jgi:aspartate-semialdehyde dehydrogenase
MSAKKISDPVVAIVGATGAVGVELLQCLEQRKFPLKELKLFASARSAGKTMKFRGKPLRVEELTEASFAGVDIGLFAKAAVAAGTVIVDNSSAFRMDPGTPLVVPEINREEIFKHKGIIANPNCSAIISITPLWPVHKKNRIKRMIISTYQAASGAGAAAMEELRESTRAYLDGKPFQHKVLPHPYAFNAFSHNTKIDPATGHNEEETKVINETRKIFGDPSIAIGITCVRIPVLRAHCVSVTFECEKPISPEEVRAIIADAPGCRLVDDQEHNYFPMPVDASGKDEILVGRIRRDLSDSTGRSISIFSAGDQLLKGAALNAVQIAEQLLA